MQKIPFLFFAGLLSVNLVFAGTVPVDTITGIKMISNGNVGVGTTTPSAKLDVQGTFNSSGKATFSDSVRAGSFRKTGGTSSQFLKADGSVDNTGYLSSAAINNYIGNYTEATPVSYALYGSWGITTGNLATESRDWLQNPINGTSSDESYDNENHGVVMDFGSAVPLRKIFLYSDAYRNINSFRVDYSADNVNWTTIEVFPQPIPQSPFTFSFNSGKNITARYWRWAINSWTKERQVTNYYFYEMVAYR